MKIKFFAYYRDIVKAKEIQFTYAATLNELLINLCDTYGKKLREKIYMGNKLSDEVIILVNGVNIIHLKKLNTQLKEDDVIAIFPVVAGG